ncbi:hypothetical protein RRG08_040150 [Elysia crispata]|uniref:Uncharacterized protein n=1 Tax=Elysia crispata TaxID=231223 RepID=A0AAE0XW00_9GAST|nr:hypothetical protein RRG08_040150 [Elysia crispata]
MVMTVDGYDMRGADGKKKKFKPLSAVRKLFGGKKRKKEESVVAVKAQSTTALHSSRYRDEEDEDDDDGGFKSHQQKPVGLVAGTRSLSEDSVFSPEPREAPIGSFPKSAVSEESLPKSAFQSELFSKLSKRRSQYSDDDRDDGLPRSPVPPVTTADVIMGTPLKPAGKKSNNRDSDQSLISVDSSENEEDKLFETNWKSAVPSIRSKEQDRQGSSSDMDPLDFSSIQKTELLTSGAAKDRISVKPKARRATSKSRKKGDTNSPLSLPSLNEESPTGTGDTSNSVLPSGSKYTKTTPSGGSSLTIVTASAPTNSNAVKASPVSNLPSPVSSPTNTPSETLSKSTSNTPALHSGGTEIAASSRDAKSSDGSKKGVSVTVVSGNEGKLSAVDKTAQQSSGKVSPTGKNPETLKGSESGSNTSRLAARFLQSDKNQGNNDDSSSPTSPTKSVVSADEAHGGVSLKSRMSQFQTNSSKNPEADANGRTSGLKASDAGAKFSPKSEDFRLKRQNRSKTLPGGFDKQEGGESGSQGSPGLQRAKSHRVTGSSTQSDIVLADSNSSKSASSVDSIDKKTAATASAASTSSAVSSLSQTSTVNKLGNRFAAFENNSSSSEPAWMNMVKKKKEDSDGKSSTPGGDSRAGATGSTPKSVFSSQSYLEKKRGSVDSSSSGGNSSSRANTPRDASKAPESSSSSSSTTTTHISQGKKESIEINLSEMNSSKSSASKTATTTSSPSSSTSTSSVFPSSSSPTASTADRARLFSGGSQNSSTPSTKPFTGSHQDSASITASETQGGINQHRGGSVRTSPTKSTTSNDSLKPWQSGRSSSVKVSPAFLAASSPTSTLASVSKPSGVAASAKTGSVSSTSKPQLSSLSESSTSPTVPSTTLSTSSSSSGRFAQPVGNNNNKNNSNNNNNTSLASSQSVMVTATSTTASATPTSSTSPTRSSSVKFAQTSALTSKPPPAASAFGVKSSGVKSVSFSGVKPDNSSSSSLQSTTIITNTASSSSSSPRSTNLGASVISVNSSSSTTPAPISSSQSNLSKTPTGSATGRSNPVRAHSSFTHPSSVKPVISPSSTSSINKSPSMRATHTPSSSLANKFTTPASKRPSIDEQKEEVKPSTTVPAWRANLATKKDKEMKIEIIESASKSQSSTPASSCAQQNKAEVVMRKSGEKSAFSEAAKKTDPASSTAAEKLNNRSSRVLDMVKNFQNLQVSS